MNKLVEGFGYANIAAAAAGFVFIEDLAQWAKSNISSCVLMLVIMTLVSAALAYASRQKAAGTDIGHKTYPATLVAYLLFALISYRWLFV